MRIQAAPNVVSGLKRERDHMKLRMKNSGRQKKMRKRGQIS